MAKIGAWLFFLLVIVSKGNGQSIDTLLNRYNKKVPQEKTYLHFDNQVYAPGETVWYKAYLLIGNEPSWLSRNLYVDWRDQEGNLLGRTVAPVLGFSASGSFELPQQLKGDMFHAIAYTRWMLNFDSAFLFRKTFVLAQPQAAALPVQNSAPSLVFLPEGGDMVEGLPASVAFKATTASGMPLAVSGTLMNTSGQPAGSFRSWHNGMGKLQFTPQKGEQYTAEWTDSDGNHYTTKLPQARSSGITLSFANASGARIFSIERNAVLEDRFKRLSVVATMNQQVVFRAAAGFTDKTRLVSTLPVKDLPSGILQFTVFDINQVPVAERLLFVNNHEYESQPRLFNDTISTEKRTRSALEIELPDTSLSSLSLSIMDESPAFDPNDQIITRLLLTGELKGYIHEPAYYFSSRSDTAAAALDLVMLTHGWRRFSWEQVLAGGQPLLKHAADTNFISVSGRVTQGRKKEETVSLVVAASDSTERLFYLPIAPDGTFGERNLVLFDTAKLYLLTAGTALKPVGAVMADNHFLPQEKSKHWYPPIPSLAAIKGNRELMNRYTANTALPANGFTLQGVTVKARTKTRSEELNERYASPLYNAVDAYQLNVVDDPNAGSSMSVFHYMEGKVAGLRAYNIFGTSVKPQENRPKILWRGEEVVFMINEMPADVSTVQVLPMSNVALIKLFRNSFFGYKTGGAGNVVAIYTKKGNDEIEDERKGLPFVSVAGYTPVRQFYSPDYSSPAPVNIADKRRTLLWQPNITTGGDSRTIKVSFYNNDYSTSFRMVLEGVTENGKLIHFSRVLHKRTGSEP